LLINGLPGLIARPSQYIQYFTQHSNSCDPEEAMKIILGILAVLIIAASLFADYKWRQWMAARRRDRK
jgi:hypothetical protein